jgi:hypothetical protein
MDLTDVIRLIINIIKFYIWLFRVLFGLIGWLVVLWRRISPPVFALPFQSRFEHTLITGGSGHGKTQLLQQLILDDLPQIREGKRSVIVIDSQGDMLRNILSLTSVGEMAERVVLIDPNDVEHPPALNLFDFGLNRLSRYSAVEREKLFNGAIALYQKSG